MRPAASDVPICHYRLSRVEYDRAVEAGAFEPDAKLELIDGDLNATTPEGVGHTTGMDLVADCLRRVFGSGFHVRIQHPLAVDDYSEPLPGSRLEVYRDPAGAATRASPTMQPVIWSRPSRAPTYGSSSMICFPDTECLRPSRACPRPCVMHGGCQEPTRGAASQSGTPVCS